MNYPKLKKTWIFDLDGTLVKHRGYESGQDILLEGIEKLFSSIPADDMIIIITGRTQDQEKMTIQNIKKLGLRYNHIIFNAGTGARILINDIKPSGYKTSYSLNVSRNTGIDMSELTEFIKK